MVMQFESLFLGNRTLAFFNFGVKKFNHFAALHTHQMVVVLAFIEFKHRFASLKILACQKARLLELGQYPINSRQTNVEFLLQQKLVYIFGTQVPVRTTLEKLQNFHSGQSCLQAYAFQVGCCCHEFLYPLSLNRAQVAYDNVFIKQVCVPGLDTIPPNMQFQRAMGILRLNRLVCAALVLSTSACSYLPSNYVPSFVKPYKVDIQQGNFVTQQEVARLQVGMTREQVKFIMGTPLLNSPFHSNRWDYVYRLLKADGSAVQYRYTVIFENDKVARHGGENLPSDQADFLTGPDRVQATPDKSKPTDNKRPIQPSPSPAKDARQEPVSGTPTAPVLN